MNDFMARRSHNTNMARRGIPKGGPRWFLREWMDTLRVRQADMVRLTGWSKATASQLYNGKQDYSPQIVRDAARALNLEDFELLLPPDRAMALRGMRESAIRIAAEQPLAYHPPPRDGTDG